MLQLYLESEARAEIIFIFAAGAFDVAEFYFDFVLRAGCKGARPPAAQPLTRARTALSRACARGWWRAACGQVMPRARGLLGVLWAARLAISHRASLPRRRLGAASRAVATPRVAPGPVHAGSQVAPAQGDAFRAASAGVASRLCLQTDRPGAFGRSSPTAPRHPPAAMKSGARAGGGGAGRLLGSPEAGACWEGRGGGPSWCLGAGKGV